RWNNVYDSIADFNGDASSFFRFDSHTRYRFRLADRYQRLCFDAGTQQPASPWHGSFGSDPSEDHVLDGFTNAVQKRFLILVALLIGVVSTRSLLDAQTAGVTLTPTATPAVGQPGVISVSVTGSGFPSGTILPASVTVSLAPASGGPAVTTPATAVTTIVGS